MSSLNKLNVEGFSSSQISDLKKLQDSGQSSFKQSEQTTTQKSFMNHLVESIDNVNKLQATSDKIAADLSTGKTQNIHETMLAVSHAELSFNLMVQVRNKALDAYQEIMRMQV